MKLIYNIDVRRNGQVKRIMTKAQQRFLIGCMVLFQMCAALYWAQINVVYGRILSLSFIRAIYAIVTGIPICVSLLISRHRNTKKEKNWSIFSLFVVAVLLLKLITTGWLWACMPQYTYEEAANTIIEREEGVMMEIAGDPHIAYYEERRGLVQGKYVIWIWSEGSRKSFFFDAYSGEWELRQLDEW